MDKKIKVLNLYACLGVNRLLWTDCDVTAVELDPELARLYSERFPQDTVIIADAHQYLLDHYKEFDFIWSSPPCPSHSRARYWLSSNYTTTAEAIYPDMKLYEEILFLQHYYRTVTAMFRLGLRVITYQNTVNYERRNKLTKCTNAQLKYS